MSYKEHVAAHRRLSILRLLAEAPGYSANDSLIHDALAGFGLGSSRDQVRTDLAWLAEQGLVAVDALASVHIATVTTRGVDVARGRASVPGVKRPSPGS